MRFVCLGFFDESDLAQYSQVEQEQFIVDYASFFNKLTESNTLLSGVGLQTPKNGLKLWKEEGTIRTAPLDNTAQVGGIFIIEAKSTEHACSIVAEHPALQFGWFQIRPADEDLTHAVGISS